MMERLVTFRNRILAALTHVETETLRKIAERYRHRRDMDAEVDRRGNRWDRFGQEVE